jgi:hypothetical protein
LKKKKRLGNQVFQSFGAPAIKRLPIDGKPVYDERRLKRAAKRFRTAPHSSLKLSPARTIKIFVLNLPPPAKPRTARFSSAADVIAF